MNKLFKLHNVTVNHKLQETMNSLLPDVDFKTITAGWGPFDALIEKLSNKYPLWTFEINDISNKTSYRPLVVSFDVLEDKLYLGRVQREYHGSEMKMAICNWRIDKSMSRGRSYKTMDVDRAIAKIKKTFVRESVPELTAKAYENAISFSRNQLHHKCTNMRKLEISLQEKALAYAMGVGMKNFISSLSPAEQRTAEKTCESIGALSSDVEFFESIRDNLDRTASNTVVVIIDSSKYIIKDYPISGQINVFASDALPKNIAANLGLLKLVGVEESVNGIGCRVNETTFIVIVKEEQE